MALSRSSSGMDRVEEMMRAETRMSQISKPGQLEYETKAQYAWRLIRHCVKEATVLMSKENMKDITLNHGISHERRLNHIQPLQYLVYNTITRDHITLDGHVIRMFLRDGRRKDIITPDEKITRLLHTGAPFDLYLGWNVGSPEIFLMDKEFIIASMSEAVGPVKDVVYNSGINEIVTVGPGYITSWVFRYGGRYLVPRKTTREGLSETDDFQFLVLEETASHSQQAFTAYGRCVAVFNLYEGTLQGFHRNLHSRDITALLFFNPLKYLVTGAEDGTIKVWDEKWHLQLVFVGHNGCINSLAMYPYGPLIMSSSQDSTLRIWSLETCDEVDRVETSEPATQLVTTVNHDNFCSMSTTHVDLWNIQHIYTLYTTIKHKVTAIKCTDHPEFQQRVVLLCQDTSVRIISPVTGDIITSLIQPRKSQLKDAAYAIAEDNLFAVYENGEIIKCDTSKNPCGIISRWPCPDEKKACNYLLVYEYVIISELQEDTWGGVKRAIASKGIHTTTKKVEASTKAGGGNSRTLLLGGRKDGRICVFNWDTGAIDFEIEAHGTKGVLSMVANSKNDQLISAGLDNIIKVWRLYPYCQEALAPLMSFYCAHTPVHMSIMRERLAVAFQEHSIATYTVVMYSLQDKNRLDHEPSDDHDNTIVALTSCRKMRLVASCSIDGTLRVWNENNILIRLIKLNATPHSLTFCSDKGDMLIGIGQHVYKVSFKNYLPKAYRFRMVSMYFKPQKGERALPYDEAELEKMSREDVKRLKAAKSSFKFTHFKDVLTAEENDEVMRERNEKQNAFNKIEERESELYKLRNGEVTASRKAKRTRGTKKRAFQEYLKIFYDQPVINLYKDNPYEQDAAKEKIFGKKFPVKDEYREEAGPPGFFPGPKSARKSTDFQEEELPIRGDGFVPNSVLARLLWPNRKPEEMTAYVPPQMTAEQLRQIASQNKMPTLQKPQVEKQEVEFRDSTIYLEYEDEGKEEEDELEVSFSLEQSEIKEVKKAATPEPAAPSFLDKMKNAMKKAPKPPSPVESPPPPPPEEPVVREEKISKPITKIVAKRVEPKPILVPKPPVVSKPPSPPPRPRTPLPTFITQFIGSPWFDKYFPNCTEKTMPKPWSMVNFVSMLLKAMNIADFPNKVEILRAMKQLHKEHGIPNGNVVQQALLGILADKVNPPSCGNSHQKRFIIDALNLIQTLGIYGRDFYTELMAQFLDADNDIRKVVMDILAGCGLKDPHKYLALELDHWDIWSLEEEERPQQLRTMSRQWLEKWMTSFRMHLEDTIDKLKRGQIVKGRMSSQKSKDTRNRSILKRPAIDAITEGEEEDVRKMDGVQFVPGPQNMSVTFETAPDPAAVDNASYMDAINYFCEMELQKEMSKLQGNSGSTTKTVEESTSTAVKNTVLVLPKIPGKSALVRLGETHTSKCRASRETPFYVDIRLPPLVSKNHSGGPTAIYIPPSLHLPLKTVYMNPFPSPLDEVEIFNTQPLLLTMKTSQKYFMPSRSIVPQDT